MSNTFYGYTMKDIKIGTLVWTLCLLLSVALVIYKFFLLSICEGDNSCETAWNDLRTSLYILGGVTVTLSTFIYALVTERNNGL